MPSLDLVEAARGVTIRVHTADDHEWLVDGPSRSFTTFDPHEAWLHAGRLYGSYVRHSHDDALNMRAIEQDMPSVDPAYRDAFLDGVLLA